MNHSNGPFWPIIEHDLGLDPKYLYAKFNQNQCSLSILRALTIKSRVMVTFDLDLELRSQKGHEENVPGLYIICTI